MITVLLWLLGLIYIGTCVWMMLVVLIQEGKTGGLSSMGGGSQTPSALSDTFGAGGAEKSLFKWTSWTAVVFFALALTLTLLGNIREHSGGAIDLGSATETRMLDTTAGSPAAAPGTPAEAPAP